MMWIRYLEKHTYLYVMFGTVPSRNGEQDGRLARLWDSGSIAQYLPLSSMYLSTDRALVWPALSRQQYLPT